MPWLSLGNHHQGLVETKFGGLTVVLRATAECKAGLGALGRMQGRACKPDQEASCWALQGRGWTLIKYTEWQVTPSGSVGTRQRSGMVILLKGLNAL